MKELIDQIKTLSGTYFNEIVKIRRHIHAHPELSFDEYKTASLVAEFLTKNNIEHETGVAKTGGCCSDQREKRGKKTIALQADMDALPIMELNDCPINRNTRCNACLRTRRSYFLPFRSSKDP
ncbi:MAG: hypothetical protein R2759_03640 [Bacteroidales bacterium]